MHQPVTPSTSTLLFVGVARDHKAKRPRLNFKGTSSTLSNDLTFTDYVNEKLVKDDRDDVSYSTWNKTFSSSHGSGGGGDEDCKWLVTKQGPWVYVLVAQKGYPYAKLYPCMEDLIHEWDCLQNTTNSPRWLLPVKRRDVCTASASDCCAQIRSSHWGNHVETDSEEKKTDDIVSDIRQLEKNIREQGHKFESEAEELLDLADDTSTDRIFRKKASQKRPSLNVCSGCNASSNDTLTEAFESIFSCGTAASY